MHFALSKRELSLRWLVVGSATVLSLIVASLVISLGQAGVFSNHAAMRAIAIASITYAVAAVLIVRIGLEGISRLEKLSLTDSLSGVPNRRALHLDVARLAQDGDEVALALIDLDGFKAVNDQYGHFVGDKLIKQCSQILDEICAGEGLHYRLGGDEFAIAVIGPLAGTILESTSRRLLQRLKKPIDIGDRKVSIGASIGMARSYPDHPSNSSELLRQADVAMYESKSSGKMRCTWFVQEFDLAREDMRKMEEELRQALAKGEFRINYQPLVDAADGSIVAVEALLRWDRGEREALGPDAFIPIAEETGLINSIGLWVLKQACLDGKQWDCIKLSVNISPAQLRNPEFPVQLGHVLEETGFPADRLELEITETHLVGDARVARRSLDVIRSFGVGIALDDFGTGYASIGFLRNFRFEKLKIDRSLISTAADDISSRAMMVSSIAIARAMNMGVTAEGVETDAQASFARSAGCDQMQGWLYYKAVSADEINRLLDPTNTIGDERHGHVANA